VSVSVLIRPLGIENLKRLRQASEALTQALASKAGDKLRATIVDALPESPLNITKVAGTALTARDWSSDFAKLQNLDVALSTRASESTLSGLSGKFPSAVALSDSLGNPTTTIIGAAALGWDGTYWRRLATDSSSRLRTVVESVANPSNLDVALSTRASESTLSSFVGTPDSSPPSKGVVLLGYDGTYVRRVKVTSDGKLLAALG